MPSLSIHRQRDQARPSTTEAGHLRLAAEVDWVVEGDGVDEVAAALGREFCTPYGSTLVLRFGNAVGDFDGGPLGRLWVYSGKWDGSHFDRMLADITARMASLPFAASSGGQLPYDRSIVDHQVLYHAFVYLRHILSATAPGHDQVLPALRLVLAQPHRGFARVSHWTPLALARRAEPRSMLGMLRPAAGLTKAPPGHAPLLARALLGHLPQQIEESRVEITLDVAENRFVKGFIEQALAIIEAVRVLALARREDAFGLGLLGDCDAMAQVLAPIRQHAMWRDIADMRRLPLESQVLQRRRGYKDVLRHFLLLRLACRLPPRAAKRLLEVKDIATLYEMWCFFAVEEHVTRVLGSPPISAESAQVGALEAHLPWGLRVAWEAGIELFYNLSYSQAQARSRRSYSLLLRPDIVLRVREGQNAGDHVFDAKFKVRRLDPSADEEPRGVFKPEDIYKMHTYRDALPSTRSVWILYPGSVFRFFDVERGSVGELAGLGATVEGVGAVALRPDGEARMLTEVIRKLVAADLPGSATLPNPSLRGMDPLVAVEPEPPGDPTHAPLPASD